mmetsp:Transcript_20992/g.51402  ORF Transcript_20992/g.51402 Transcript_20992/m.51402 type:complete len:217 (+) Transcript_20992:153-803(+)
MNQHMRSINLLRCKADQGRYAGISERECVALETAVPTATTFQRVAQIKSPAKSRKQNVKFPNAQFATSTLLRKADDTACCLDVTMSIVSNAFDNGDGQIHREKILFVLVRCVDKHHILWCRPIPMLKAKTKDERLNGSNNQRARSRADTNLKDGSVRSVTDAFTFIWMKTGVIPSPPKERSGRGSRKEGKGVQRAQGDMWSSWKIFFLFPWRTEIY